MIKFKTLTAAVFLGLIMVTGTHALGLGAQFNFSAGKVFAPGAALAISPSNQTHLAVNWYFGDGADSLGLTLDVTPLNWSISSGSSHALDFTLGGGVFLNLLFADDLGFNGGLRVPVGLSLFLGQRAFEIYTHVAPSFGLDILPSLGVSSPFFPIALGARLWFR